MGPTVDLNGRRRHRRSSAPLAAALILGLAVTVGALALPSAGSSAATAVPRNTAEPRISGAAEQGRRLSASRGTWTGGSLSYAFRWVRCGVGGGLPDGSDCVAISGATGSTYVLDRGGRRLPHARPRDGHEPGRLAHRCVQPHGDRRRPAGAGESSERSRLGPRRLGRHRRSRPLDAAGSRSRSRISGCAATPRAANAHPIAGATGRTYRVDVRRRRQEAPLQRYGAERDRIRHRDLRRVDDRRGAASRRCRAAPVRRVLDPGDERGQHPAARPRRRAVHAEDGHEPEADDRRADPREGHARVRRPRRVRLHPLDAEGHDRRRPAA